MVKKEEMVSQTALERPVILFHGQAIPVLQEAGGKAKALIETARAGFPVPDGLVLCSHFFKPWLEAVEQAPQWEELHQSLSAPVCEKLKAYAAGFRFTVEQAKTFSEAFMMLEGPLFSVRSSSPEEDLENLSFAGMYETCLGIPVTELEQTIARVFSSMLDIRVLQYKQQNGLSIEHPSIAVIVQVQIDSEVSGVGFSCNPQSGRRDEVMLNSAFGLGESIVSGSVTPDIYLVRREKVVQRRLAGKQTALLLDNNAGVREQVPTDPEAASLTKKQAVRLARLAKKLEVFYNRPIDMEWAIAEGKIFLLQARPVTTLKPSWEMEKLPRGVYYFRASIGEQMPNPLTPLYADYAAKHVPMTILAMVERLVGNTKMIDWVEFPSYNGYGYYKMKLGWRMYQQMLLHIKELLRVFKEYPAWIEEEELPHIRGRLAEIEEMDVSSLPEEKIFSLSHELTEMICRYYSFCQVYLAQAYTSEGAFNHFYNRHLRKKTGVPAHVFLLGEDTEPVLADKELYVLAQWIRMDSRLTEWLMKTPADQAAEALKEDNTFSRRMKEYLKRYGTMIFDLDFASPTSLENPTAVMEALKLYVSGEAEDPAKRQRDALDARQKAEKQVKALASSRIYKKFSKKLALARKFAPNRENGLANLGLCQPCVRRLLLELGRRAAKRGCIVSPQDVFWLHEEELKEASSSDLKEEVEKRKQLARTQSTLTAPVFLPENAKIVGIPVSAFLPKKFVEEPGKTVYDGIGVSSGKYTGTARVILSTEEFNTMKKGEILVTSMTTPAWTPLFTLAGAIVTDFGGPLSHSSIVAREYGVPAVLGTGGLSKLIQNGQQITVDADNGKVILCVR